MSKTKSIPFAELRRLLERLGYAEKRINQADVFHRHGDDLLVFRLYRDQELVDARDLVSTRKFLDFRGELEAAEFDAFLENAARSA
jgi:hypothetical protein